MPLEVRTKIKMDKIIKKGEGEYKKCGRCDKRFRRKKSFWNTFSDGSSHMFCPLCQKEFNQWWDSK